MIAMHGFDDFQTDEGPVPVPAPEPQPAPETDGPVPVISYFALRASQGGRSKLVGEPALDDPKSILHAVESTELVAEPAAGGKVLIPPASEMKVKPDTVPSPEFVVERPWGSDTLDSYYQLVEQLLY
ncbi:hypothetical protein MVEN_01818300 [Mycena venus]|uniref:Uncharacterized protein n=1 Tax=Mycena venus TaxID=2733690 RepID=A0A8H6XIS9_9AGAR|nr:hypothetical protein MVEN_01818300 [Mycena venus]